MGARSGLALVVLLTLGGTNAANVPASGPSEGPVPVLLVPGWGPWGGADLEPLRQRLMDQGWPASHVPSVTFRNPVGSNAHHAAEIDAAVQRIQALTRFQEVDVVDSMGGLALRLYLRTGQTRSSVRRTVFLGTSHRGTASAFLAWGSGGREMTLGSEFLAQLNAGPPIPEGVQALSIRTPVDLRIIPTSSLILLGERVRNVEI
jgi:triacylglycerol lipase